MTKDDILRRIESLYRARRSRGQNLIDSWRPYWLSDSLCIALGMCDGIRSRSSRVIDLALDSSLNYKSTRTMLFKESRNKGLSNIETEYQILWSWWVYADCLYNSGGLGSECNYIRFSLDLGLFETFVISKWYRLIIKPHGWFFHLKLSVKHRVCLDSPHPIFRASLAKRAYVRLTDREFPE